MTDRPTTVDAHQRHGQRQSGGTNTTPQLGSATAAAGGDGGARDVGEMYVTVTFTSPYYDPFGEEGELEAELLRRRRGRLAGTVPATVQAYDSTGAHRP